MNKTDATTPHFFNQPIIVRNELGDLPGLLTGLDETGQLARVTIDRDRAPQFFRDAHKSKHPNVWVSLRDVEAKG